MLWQFQCMKEGTLFYYQHGNQWSPRHLIERCPLCGSRNVRETGRSYPDVDEHAPTEVEEPGAG